MFDDTPLAGGGTRNITMVAVRSGSWVDAIQFSFDGSPAPMHGGTGGSLRDPLSLAADEYITQAWVGLNSMYVEEIRFVTNTGRDWTSDWFSSYRNPSLIASPCPVGAYRCAKPCEPATVCTCMQLLSM